MRYRRISNRFREPVQMLCKVEPVQDRAQANSVHGGNRDALHPHYSTCIAVTAKVMTQRMVIGCIDTEFVLLTLHYRLPHSPNVAMALVHSEGKHARLQVSQCNFFKRMIKLPLTRKIFFTVAFFSGSRSLNMVMCLAPRHVTGFLPVHATILGNSVLSGRRSNAARQFPV